MAKARSALAANPADLNATARLFHYFRNQNNPGAARRALLEFRLAKESRPQPWTAAELLTAARLFERLPDLNEAARLYYALYSLPGAPARSVEDALAGLAGLLLSAPEQSIRIGSGDLSFYRDIAGIDSSPGFLNGILSLVLNSTSPQWAYSQQDQKAVAYFHRARAADLVALLEQRFPSSRYRPALRAKLVEAYAAYGDNDAVVRTGRAHLVAFPAAPERIAVAMLVADALAAQKQSAEEFAVYDQLLGDLAARAQRVPLGKAQVRSPGYAQVLDRYLERLSALGRPMDALRVYRREIDRNPDDPGLYARLAAFVEQNKMDTEIEAVYRRAIARFPDRSWYHALARWYLREKKTAAIEQLSRDVASVFSGAELEEYLRQTALSTTLYRQINLYAHQRFPEDLAFVRNLLNAYAQQETHDPEAYRRLLHDYWYYDATLRRHYLEELSNAGELYNELGALRKANPQIAAGQFDKLTAANPAAAQFDAEAEAWLSHFEASAPAFKSLADAYPGKREFTERAASSYRSLANTATAAALAEMASRSEPRQSTLLATAGEVYADREQFARARAVWNRMPAIDPGKPESYLAAATVFWDYYQFDDALRVIGEARRKFDDPALYAYEAGAIQEGKRAFDRAVEQYMAGALAGDMQCQSRLIRLAARPAQRAIVERLTRVALAKGGHEALSLRVAILEQQQRTRELETLLVAQSTDLAWIQETAKRLGFDAIEERALDRQGAATADPLEKMRLRIALVKLYESKKNTAAATRTMDALLATNPLILGVVRAAVDFRTRNHQPERAVEALLAAAKAGRKDLADQFTLEAARIETATARFDRARELLSGLLAADPYRTDYLGAMADTYLRANDDAGFRAYQLATIQALQKAPLPAADRTGRIVALRRSLIPALTRGGDFKGAVDQYIEAINRYPEDESLAQEAAHYAVTHSQVDRLLAFYRKTTAEAPRDYRWPIVLARVETVAEDYPAAIVAYELAMKARPDRTDVVQARARLEERLMHFEDAARNYTHLYEMTYRDPQWMRKVAELRARLRQTDAAVAALTKAVLGSKSESASALFEIARQLDAWNLVPQALSFAERGEQLGGDATEDALYVRVLTRARRIEKALAVTPPNAAQQMSAIAEVVQAEYTAEEKAHLENLLSAKDTFAYLPLVTACGLPALEARWRFQASMSGDKQLDTALVELQKQRGRFIELGKQLEQYAAALPADRGGSGVLSQAAAAYLAEGDRVNAMRLLGGLARLGQISGRQEDWYLATLSRDSRDQLLSLARTAPQVELRNRAVRYAIASGDSALARGAILARGQGLPPVWTKAYTALAGVYFADKAPAVHDAFIGALGNATIGERIKTVVNHDEQFAGRVWFYYGARYGEYMASEDYLPASLEAAPGSIDAYLALGDYYAGARNVTQAIAQFEKALQLDPDSGDAQNRIARLLWTAGRKSDAIARWRAALAAFERLQGRGVEVPPPFWDDVGGALRDIGRSGALAALKSDVERLLRDYANRNGEYRIYALLEAAYHASLDSGQDTAWVLALSEEHDLGRELITSMGQLPGLTQAQRIQLARQRVAAAEKSDRMEAAILSARFHLVSLLLDAGDVKSAAAEWPARAPHWAKADIRLADAAGTLASLLDRYRRNPEDSPTIDELRDAAMDLHAHNRKPAELDVLEYLYTRELEREQLDAPNFLGLAQVKLERADTPGAIALLRRMNLVSGEPFETFMPAAELLTRYHKDAEAAKFIEDRVRAVPWDTNARPQPKRPLPAQLDKLREALASAPRDPEVRLATTRAALAAGRDSLALAIAPPKVASLAQGLAKAAERIDDLDTAISHLEAAEQDGQQDARPKLDALRAERNRRRENAARQPAIRDTVEQPGIVRARLARSEK